MEYMDVIKYFLIKAERHYAQLRNLKDIVADSSTINGETMELEEDKIVQKQLLLWKNKEDKIFELRDSLKKVEAELKNKNVKVKDATNNLDPQHGLAASLKKKTSILTEITGLAIEIDQLRSLVTNQLSNLEQLLIKRKNEIESNTSSDKMPNDQPDTEFVPQETNGVESDCTHEVLRLQEVFLYLYFLSRFQEDDVCDDFLKGENGAIKLTHTQLSQLKKLFQLFAPGQPTEKSDVVSVCYELAQNNIFLMEGSDKEIAGTTYKTVKELLIEIEACGYFPGCSYSYEDSDYEYSSDEISNDQSNDIVPDKQSAPQETNSVEFDCTTEFAIRIQADSESCIIEPVEPSASPQNAPFQEVLEQQGSFNFLQESQIDLYAPHVDPAMVAVHQMEPAPSATFASSSYPIEENGNSGVESADVVVPQPVMNAPQSVVPPPVMAPMQHNFDPSHPIPTQTFTNHRN